MTFQQWEKEYMANNNGRKPSREKVWNAARRHDSAGESIGKTFDEWIAEFRVQHKKCYMHDLMLSEEAYLKYAWEESRRYNN